MDSLFQLLRILKLSILPTFGLSVCLSPVIELFSKKQILKRVFFQKKHYNFVLL